MSIAPAPGIYTPVVTFFKKDGHTLDIESQIKHAKYLSDNGIEGLVIFGSFGENAHLTLKERVSVVKAIHDALPHITIISGITSNCLEDAIEETKLLHEVGSSYAMALPSHYFGPATYQQGVIDWYTALADSSPLPVLLYVYPDVSNKLAVTLSTVKKLSAHPNIVGAKFSYNDLADYTIITGDKEIAANNFHFFSGLGQLLTSVMLVGGKGIIGGLSNALPKVYVKIFQLAQEGKYEEATALQHQVTPVENLLGPDAIVNVKKAVQKVTGIGEYTLGRAPLNIDSPKEKSEPFLQALEKLAKTEKSL